MSHCRLCQKKVHLPSTQRSEREEQRCELGCNSVHNYQAAQRAMRWTKTRRRSQQCAERERTRFSKSNRQRTLWRDAMPHANEAIGKSHMRVWCARKEATRLFATTMRAESESAVNVIMCRRGVWVVLVCHVDGKRRVLWPAGDCGQRVLCVYRCAWTTNKQLAERWANGRVHYLSRRRASSILVNASQSQSRDGAQLNWSSTENWSIGTNWPPHEIEVTKWRSLVKWWIFISIFGWGIKHRCT